MQKLQAHLEGTFETPDRLYIKIKETLVHLHLTFSGLMCILSLEWRQEQCPFTTRLRVLKLAT